MSLNFSQLGSLHFWFDLTPGNYSSFFISALLVVFALTFVIGIAGQVVSEKRRNEDKLIARIYRKIGTLGLTMGIIGVFLLFFYYEQIYIFSARFWLVLWLLGALYWIKRIHHLASVKIPQEKKTVRDQEEFEKYLPKPNRG